MTHRAGYAPFRSHPCPGVDSRQKGAGRLEFRHINQHTEGQLHDLQPLPLPDRRDLLLRHHRLGVEPATARTLSHPEDRHDAHLVSWKGPGTAARASAGPLHGPAGVGRPPGRPNRGRSRDLPSPARAALGRSSPAGRVCGRQARQRHQSAAIPGHTGIGRPRLSAGPTTGGDLARSSQSVRTIFPDHRRLRDRDYDHPDLERDDFI